MFNKILGHVYQEGEGGQGGGGGGSAETVSKSDFDALNLKLTDQLSQNEKMRGQMTTLLSETKVAKEERREREQAAIDEAVAAKDKMQKSGDFEALFKSSEEAREKLVTEIASMKDGTAKDKRTAAANKLSATISEGENVGLLASFVMKRLTYADGEIKVLDSKGELTVSTLDDLAKEFQGNETYASLLKGNKSSGGGAGGGNKGGGAAEQATVTRSEFDQMNQVQRRDFSVKGGKVVDD